MVPLRYLLMAGHVPPGGGGGIVRYTVELAGALARRPDVELHLLLTGPVPRLERLVPAGRVHRGPAAGTALQSAWERWGAGAGAGMDVVHGVKHIVPRRRAPGPRPALRVLTVHDMLLLDRPADFPAAKRLLLRSPYLASIRDADLVLCVSAATRQRLLAHVPSVAGRARVVPLAVPTSLEEAVPVPVRELAGRRFALVVGDSNPRKNLRLAVDTWPRVRDLVPDAVLAVVGPPDWGASHRGARWDEQLAAGAVRHLGQVPDGTLRWCYEHAAAVLCPSLVEGFGLPAAEAARFGAPLVISDDPALGEAAAATPGTTVTAVAVHDEAAWVRAVAATLTGGRRALDVAGGWDWDAVADATIAAAREATGVSG